jgi:hypothetical protein
MQVISLFPPKQVSEWVQPHSHLPIFRPTISKRSESPYAQEETKKVYTFLPKEKKVSKVEVRGYPTEIIRK